MVDAEAVGAECADNFGDAAEEGKEPDPCHVSRVCQSLVQH